MISNNLESWTWLTPLIGDKRVGTFLSETASLNVSGRWIEIATEVIRFRYLASDVHSIGTEERNCALCLIQGGRKIVFNIDIQLISDRPGLSIFGVETVIHTKFFIDLLLQSVTQGFYVSSFRHCDVGGVIIVSL